MKNNQQALLEKIAKEIMGLETLETRNSDSLDFHENGVWTIKRALELAFEAGAKSQDGEDYALINTGGNNWTLAKDLRDEEGVHFCRKVINLGELEELTEYARNECAKRRSVTVTKEKHLGPAEFKEFAENLLMDHDWITPEDGGPDGKGGDRCIRVVNTETGRAILVNNEGFSYARYTAIEN